MIEPMIEVAAASTTEELYIVAIAAMLPLTACLLVAQVNPYHALVIRGILGAIAALVYALLGAADVALTEALVGTLLSITLYAVAVRSSLNMRLGIVKSESIDTIKSPDRAVASQQLFAALRAALAEHYLRLETTAYEDRLALEEAIARREIHAAYTAGRMHIRIQRLYDIARTAKLPHLTHLSYTPAGSPPENNNQPLTAPSEEPS